jgi:hypothetical protein
VPQLAGSDARPRPAGQVVPGSHLLDEGPWATLGVGGSVITCPSPLHVRIDTYDHSFY